MNAYRIDVWRSVKHNGKFVTNIQRQIVVHARNKEEAESKIKLTKESVNKLPALLVEASNEFIYSCEKIGTVTIQPFYVYSDKLSPTLVEDYKNNLKQFNLKSIRGN
jgi:hypothetical protein